MTDLTPDQIKEYTAEAYRRGIMPPDKKALYEEAMKRGMVPKIDVVSSHAGASGALGMLQGGGESAAGSQANAPDRTTRLQRFGTGVADPVHGLTQAVEHAGIKPPEAIMNFNNWLADKGVPVARMTPGGEDELLQRREAQIASERGQNAGSLDVARTLGQAVIPGVVSARIGAGPAASGAISSALMPVTDPEKQKDYWETKGIESAEGGVLGKGVSLLGKAAAGAIKPTFDGAVKKLMDAGVKLTPGQLTQGAGKWLEEMGQSVPLLGVLIRKASADSIGSFNTAAANEALKPIGERIPTGVKPGEDLIKAGQSALSDAYDRAIQKVGQFRTDGVFWNELSNLKTLVGEMPKSHADQFQAILDNRLNTRLAPRGTMDGQTFKQVESELGTMARGLKRSGAGQGGMADGQLGTALSEVQGIMRKTLERQNPDAASALAAVNKAWAGFQRVEDASIRRVASDGVFTPADLLSSVKSWATGSGQKHSLAAGDQMLQDFAKAGQEVLPNKLPNSTTADRIMLRDAVGGGAAGAAGGSIAGAATAHPLTALGLGAGLAAYTKPGIAAVNSLAHNGVLAPVQALLDYGGAKTGAQFLQQAAAGFPSVQAMLAKGAKQAGNLAAPVAGPAVGVAAANGLAPFIQPTQQPGQ